ncbi:MAG TPA: nicotinate-nucleotide adenylyltransferase [Terriglobales bacterium]|jgi:nicotinate-nucleotide adenylyltransferase|nr:nicotinate-nucleotide adenylyltransferase [Terriglobales bacterium]
MNIGLFGGTFDPIHNGHLAVAHAAAERCKLAKVLFVPGDIPPHKRKQPITNFIHRYAMVALALQGEKKFFPSLLEAPREKYPTGEDRVHYSIDTVQRLKASLAPTDKLFFIMGIDAFREISTWREPEALLRECEFIVVSRPGYYLADVADALPASLRPKTVRRPSRRARPINTLKLRGITLHLLEGVRVPAAATDIRAAIGRGSKLEKLVNPAVAEYIKKMKLYANPASEVE